MTSPVRRLAALALGLAIGMPTAPFAARAAASASQIEPGSVNRATMQVEATYDVDATIWTSSGVVIVATTIDARNVSGVSVDRLELNTVATRLGEIKVTEAAVDGVPVHVTVNDQTLMVPLGGILPNGAAAEVRIKYRATLRTSLTGPTGSSWLFTRYAGTLSLYRWIPWVSRARPFDRPNFGDPFVTPSSPLVHVDLSLDKPMVLAAPAASLPTAPSKTWSFQVEDVRDVAIVLAPDFTVTNVSAGGVPIRAYSRPGGVTGSTLADRARAALLAEADILDVPYPWPAFTVVETAGGVGMESPALVWIPANTAASSVNYLVHHETAHQWFYGLVGNDQQREPFADEAAADLLARTALGSLRSTSCAVDDLDRRITQYTRACYYETIYIQGGNVLNNLRAKMGTALFWATIRDYLEDNRFQLSSTFELLEALRAASPVDLLPVLRARFPTLY